MEMPLSQNITEYESKNNEMLRNNLHTYLGM